MSETISPAPAPVETVAPAPAAPLVDVHVAAPPAPEPAAPAIETVAAAPDPVAAIPEPVATATEPPALVPHTETPTLLEQASKKPEQAAPVETVAPEPVAPVYEFAMPEGVQIEPDRLSGYTGILGKHGVPPQAAQEILDLYIAERQRDAVQQLAAQHQAFADYRAARRGDVMKDPELGGANFDTTMDLVASVRDRVLPPSGPIRDAFNQFDRETGAGDHPEFLRMMARIGALLREPAPPSVAPRNPAPDAARPPNARRGNGMAPIYDHATSPQPRGMR